MKPDTHAAMSAFHAGIVFFVLGYIVAVNFNTKIVAFFKRLFS